MSAIQRAPNQTLVDEAFARAAGVPLIGGNRVRLLKDARENYPAWLEAIRAAKDHIYFESYIIHEDDAGREFADAFISKAEQGVRTRVIYDWMGGLGKTSRRFWNRLRASGVDVRCYNPPRLDNPLGWVSREHGKMLAIDGEIGFVTGLCVGMDWVGNPAKNIEPWRDTGVEVRGPAVAHIERAFATVWAMIGTPILEERSDHQDAGMPAGDMNVRVIATVPGTAGILRVNELVAALAQKTLWLTDAYFVGTTSYVQALKEAARHGIDVRLLVPGGTDIPILRPISRAGYRPLLDAGVRVFEWNGSMLHAKTAVADSRWARVGSTNLNIASWFGNCELDLMVENETFAHEMEEMYLQDLTNSTEVILDERNGVRAAGSPGRRQPVASSGGSTSRAAAGALRIGSAVGAAVTNQRVFEPVENRILASFGGLLLGLAVLFKVFPAALVYPAVLLFGWLGLALVYKACRLRLKRGSRVAKIKSHSSTTDGHPTSKSSGP
jgi:cardiolipin synthase A/B